MARGEKVNTGALYKYLQAEWLKRGKDQTSFLSDAGLSSSWFSNLKADEGRGPSREALAKLRATYGLSIDTMVDILYGKLEVDEYGRIVNRR